METIKINFMILFVHANSSDNMCLCMQCMCVTCAKEYAERSPKKPCFLVLLFSFQYRLITNWVHSIVSWRVKI